VRDRKHVDHSNPQKKCLKVYEYSPIKTFTVALTLTVVEEYENENAPVFPSLLETENLKTFRKKHRTCEPLPKTILYINMHAPNQTRTESTLGNSPRWEECCSGNTTPEIYTFGTFFTKERTLDVT